MGVWPSLAPFVFQYFKVRMWVLCVSSNSGRPNALQQGKEEKECQRKSAEVKLPLNCHFQQYEQVLVGLLVCVFVCVCVCFLKLSGLIVKSRQTIKSKTSAVTVTWAEFKKAVRLGWQKDKERMFPYKLVTWRDNTMRGGRQRDRTTGQGERPGLVTGFRNGRI